MATSTLDQVGAIVLEYRKIGVVLLYAGLGVLWGHTGWALGVYEYLGRVALVYVGLKSAKDAVIEGVKAWRGNG